MPAVAAAILVWHVLLAAGVVVVRAQRAEGRDAPCDAGGGECTAPPRGASSETVLLQRAKSVSHQGDDARGSLGTDYPYWGITRVSGDDEESGQDEGEECRTAVRGEPCYLAITWAKSWGIRIHPDWYPGLDAGSSLEDFQRLLHQGGHGPTHEGPANFAGCKAPCPSGDTTAPPDATTSTTTTGGGSTSPAETTPAATTTGAPETTTEATTPAATTTEAPETTPATTPAATTPAAPETTPAETTQAPETTTGGDHTPPAPTRFLSWNVYYKDLASAGRVDGVARGIAEVAPEIASIQEMWTEKTKILPRLREITNQDWAFAEGGETEKVWDGDVLYRSDLWEHLESGVHKYGDHWKPYEGRGITWAALRRRSDGFGVLVVATHPWCCTDDKPVLEAMELVQQQLTLQQEKYPFPVVLMGDMNADYTAASQKLLREGKVWAHSKKWSVPVTFEDSYAETHPQAPNPSTGFGVKIDYVYFQKAPLMLGATTDAHVWPNLPGGSDHFAVSGDVILGGSEIVARS